MNWPAQGIHRNVPFAEYRKCDITQADDHLTVTGKSVSKSLICDFIADPGAWKASPPKQQTAAMKGGSLFDCLLTEPDKFESRYVVAPETYKPINHIPKVISTASFAGEWNGRKTACQDWKKQMEDQGFVVLTDAKIAEMSEPKEWNMNADACRDWHDKRLELGLTVISQDSLKAAQDQIAAVYAHPDAARLIRGSQKQVAFRHKTKHSFWSKGLIDLLPEDPSEGLGDLKVCRPSALESRRSLARYIYEFQYHIQGGSYTEGYSFASGEERTRFRLIFVASEKPYRVAVVELPFAAVMLGADQYRAGVNRFAECLESNKWPSIWDGEIELDLPEYAYSEGGEP